MGIKPKFFRITKARENFVINRVHQNYLMGSIISILSIDMPAMPCMAGQNYHCQKSLDIAKSSPFESLYAQFYICCFNHQDSSNVVFTYQWIDDVHVSTSVESI